MKINLSISRSLISVSAVPLSIARPMVAGWDKARYEDIFLKFEHSRNKYRIYLPLVGNEINHAITVPQQVSEVLQEQGYVVEDYLAGIAVRTDNPKKKIKIGKLLKEPSSKKVFDNDPQRSAIKNVKQWVVISRHPYDILGMSFDRGWTSCMNVHSGVNKHYLQQDVKAGTLVAYLIKDLDKNINSPSARILLKPYFLDKGKETLLSPGGPDTIYGTAPRSFYNTVVKFCEKINAGKPNGTYLLSSLLYDDHGQAAVYRYSDSEFSALIHREFDNEAGNSVIQMLTSNGLPTHLLKVAAGLPLFKTDEDYRAAILGNPNTDSSILILGATEDNSLYLRRIVILNPSCTEEILLIGAKDSELDIREGAMMHPQATERVLLIGAKDADKYIRAAVMENPNATPSILSLGIGDSDTVVALKAWGNPNMPIETLRQGLKMAPSIIKAVLENPSADEPMLAEGMLLNEFNAASVMKNISCPAHLLLLGIAATQPQTVRLSAARNTNATAEVLKIGAVDVQVKVRLQSMQSPATSLEILTIGMQDKIPLVRETVMNSPNVTPSLLLQGIHDSDEGVRERAVKSPNATILVLEMGLDPKHSSSQIIYNVSTHRVATPKILLACYQYGIEHKEEDTCQSSVHNQNADPSLLELALTHEDEYVRIAAVENHNATESMLRTAMDDPFEDVRRSARAVLRAQGKLD